MRIVLTIITSIILAGALLFSANAGAATIPGISGGKPAETQVKLPEPLTKEAVRQLLSTLSDQQVRDLLLQRLDAVAEQEAANTASNQSTFAFLAGAVLDIGISVRGGLGGIPAIGEKFSEGMSWLVRNYGLSGLLMIVLKAAASVVLGFVAAQAFGYFTRNLRAGLANAAPQRLGPAIRLLAMRLGLDLLKVAIIGVIAYAGIHLLLAAPGEKAFVWRFTAWIILSIFVMAAIARFNLSPNHPEWRLVSVDDDSARLIYRRMVFAGPIIGLFPLALGTRAQLGIDPGTIRVGFWLNIILYSYFLYAIFTARKGIAQALIGRDDLVGPFGKRLAHLWPWVAMFFAILSWAVVEAISGAGRFDLIINGQNFTTLILIAFVPALDTALRGLIRQLSPPMVGEGPVAERAYVATKRGYLRIGRVLLVSLLIVTLASIWDIDLFDTESQSTGIRLVAELMSGILYFIAGYLIWEAIGIWINIRLAREQTESGVDLESDEPGGGEGGGQGISRLATVLPVIKLALQTLVVVMTVLIGLDAFGINATPLLAGAGVVGLALGFGAQTLVRDVVSGLFFLIDDAFRVGEYLVIGETVGTVERISLRSLRLRHHMGAIHTIPYGEIHKVTNNSRDWVIMKLKFTFPFETDVNRIKKIFKQIGKEMLEADYAGDLIQTFKSQGVYDVDDVGIVIRGKFMAKPGSQWVIRKDVYTRVQKALDAAGIQFARKEVRVQIPGLDAASNLTEDQKKAVGAAVADAVEKQKPA